MMSHLLFSPASHLVLLTCRLLWKLNQPTEGGAHRHTILLRSREDLDRLKLAIVMKQTIEMNDPEEILNLESFSRGRLLSMPSIKREDIELIDADVARCFFYSEHYYQALQKQIEKDIEALREEIGDDKLAGL